MPKIISVHSFRAAIGKTNLVASMATQVARQGYRVGILDLNFPAPGIHMLFGLDGESFDRSLVDYLWSLCPLEDAVIALHEREDAERPFLKQTKLWLIPATRTMADVARVSREGYDVGLLHDGIPRLVDSLALDYLIVDTQPGLNEETMLSIASCDILVVVFRPDQQHYQGTGVIVEVARKLDVPKVRLVVTHVTSRHDAAELRQRVVATYGVPVAGLLPYSEDVAFTGSANVFSALYPEHPWSQALREIVADVTELPLVPDGS